MTAALSVRNLDFAPKQMAQVTASAAYLGGHTPATGLVASLGFPFVDHHRNAAHTAEWVNFLQGPDARAVPREWLFAEKHGREFSK